MRHLRLACSLFALCLASAATARAQDQPRAEHYPAGTIGALSRARRLTWPEVQQLLAALKHFPDDSGSVALAHHVGPEVPVREALAALDGAPAARRAITAAGLTPFDFLVVNDAFNESFLTVVLQNITSAMPVRVPRQNLELLRAHREELVALVDQESGGKDTSEVNAVLRRDAVPPPTVSDHELDSLSLLVSTDSLARVVVKSAGAPDESLPSLGVATACEIAILNWRHGTGPARIAMRRMRDSLNVALPGTYERASRRLIQAGMLTSMSDERCRWSRWPQADARLNSNPRPR